jgi:3-oxoacyl-(acyl-carrier-protein) synthase
MMLLQEGTATNVLVGGVDEITDFSFEITSRFGLFKKDISSNLDLFQTRTKGTIAGEGAAFFLLNNVASTGDYAILDAVTTFYKPVNRSEIEANIQEFLADQSTTMDQIDIVLCGRNGDLQGDKVYDHLNETIFKNTSVIHYKHLCGEYPTSTAFALWMAAGICKTGRVPQEAPNSTEKAVRKILIYNHFQMIHHSLMLVSAC